MGMIKDFYVKVLEDYCEEKCKNEKDCKACENDLSFVEVRKLFVDKYKIIEAFDTM